VKSKLPLLPRAAIFKTGVGQFCALRVGQSCALSSTGQPQRIWVAKWNTWDEARAALAELTKQDRTFRYDDFGEGGGTTHIPSSVLTRHLPDDEG